MRSMKKKSQRRKSRSNKKTKQRRKSRSNTKTKQRRKSRSNKKSQQRRKSRSNKKTKQRRKNLKGGSTFGDESTLLEKKKKLDRLNAKPIKRNHDKANIRILERKIKDEEADLINAANAKHDNTPANAKHDKTPPCEIDMNYARQVGDACNHPGGYFNQDKRCLPGKLRTRWETCLRNS